MDTLSRTTGSERLLQHHNNHVVPLEMSIRKNSTLQRVLQENTFGTVKGLKNMTKAKLVKAVLDVE